jgi:hypothetical protein
LENPTTCVLSITGCFSTECLVIEYFPFIKNLNKPLPKDSKSLINKMNPEFHNKPGVSLRGSTWDVKHLDSFLASAWGEKLFQSKLPTESSTLPQQLQVMSANSSIRPSAAFLTLPRTQPPVQSFEKRCGNTLIHSSTNPYSPPKLNLDQVTTQLASIEHLREKDLKELSKVIPPSKRKQLFEAEKHRNLEYLKLKHEKIRETKKNRILSNEYREAILGVEVPKRATSKSAGFVKGNEQVVEIRKKLRADNIARHTRPNPNIQFFNEDCHDSAEEKPRGLKKVDQIPNHYHDTYGALFVNKPATTNPERADRLKYLWRGCRDFNIVTGVLF